MYEVVKYLDSNQLVAGSNEKYEIVSHYYSEQDSVFSSLYKVSLESLETDYDKCLEVVDLQFDRRVKKAERSDYLFAVLSGLAAAAVDQYAVGTVSIPNFDHVDKKELFKLAENLLLHANYSREKVSFITEQYDALLKNAEEKIIKIPDEVEVIKDFSRSFNFTGLFFSVISKLTGVTVVKCDDNTLRLKKDPDYEKIAGFSIQKKIRFAISVWLIEQANEYRMNGKFGEETDDILRFANGLKTLKEMIKNLSSSNIFKKQSYDRNKIVDWAVRQIENEEEIEIPEKAMKLLLVKQTLPVVFNKCLIKTWVFIRLLLSELEQRKVKSVAGLKYISIDFNSDENVRLLARMETVSAGVFAAVDGADALAFAIKTAAKSGDKRIEAGIIAYLSKINFVNTFDLVAVVKADYNYIKEDVSKYLDRTFIAKQEAAVKAAEFAREKTIKYLELNKPETRILYSLELQLVERDIMNTMDSETQIRKGQWKDEWVTLSQKTVDLKQLFDNDPEKTYALLKTHAETDGNKDWVYKIALELLCFRPYSCLDQNEPNKYRGLKLTDNSYVDEVFCRKQNYVTKHEAEEMLGTFKSHYDRLSGKTGNTIKGVAGTAAAAAVIGVSAFAFAPAIAVALAGGLFPTLSGAALTSASLAFFGGGAIAAGGMGMAGGTLVIAGGGALLGLGAGGATLTSLALLSSPQLIIRDNAKLLTTCDYILNNKYKMFEQTAEIQKQLEQSVNDYQVQISLVEHSDNMEAKEKKELLKMLKKGVEVIERTNKSLVEINRKYTGDDKD